MNGFPWLTILLWAPLLGGVIVALLPRRATPSAPKQIALGFSLLILAYSIVIAVRFQAAGGMQLREQYDWISAFGAHYALGVDGLGLSLVMLTTILTPVVLLASWHDADSGGGKPASFFAWLLVLECLCIGCFTANDLFLFYVLFEAVLLPVYFLIGGFGGPRRAAASMKFLIYSLTGGLIMLAAVIGVYVESAKVSGHPTYLVSELARMHIGGTAGKLIFCGLFFAFAVKAPLFPVHTWLPDACENGTAGTNTMLVSVMDKIGSFAMIRFCLELFPDASKWATPLVVVLAIISILYGALMAIGSKDIFRLIAYTSVSHFGFIVLGIFVMNSQGLSGANLYMFAHGLSTAAAFLVAGFMKSRRGSALVQDFGGVDKVAPVLAGTFLVANLSLLSLPGLSPFVSELLVIVGAWVHSAWAAGFAVVGIVLAAAYALILYQRTMTGPVVHPQVEKMRDLNLREVVSLVPVILLLVVLGFYPQPLLKVLNPSVQHTMSQVGKTDPPPSVAGAKGSQQ
ncbi:MAG: NADH-quinone oxidoreductase subunit M [Marmoricola sp.]